ncbi:MAG: patatin-like phospholipase family protein [Firmicutes bacterium]|nr:patatin-like phospholipase family protein [Bacillota bacterium]
MGEVQILKSVGVWRMSLFKKAEKLLNLKGSDKGKKKIGLALGGGGARGFCHVGVLKVLEKEGIVPDIITGTSMGSMVGGVYAAGVSLNVIENYAKKARFSSYFELNLQRGGLISGKRVMSIVRGMLGDDINIENLNYPFGATTVDLITGQQFDFVKGSLLQAIRASISIPGLFIPVKYEHTYEDESGATKTQDYLLIDGGVLNRVPIQLARQLGADFVIGVDAIGPVVEGDTKYNSIKSIVERAYKIIDWKSAQNEVTAADILITPEMPGSTVLDFKKGSFNIDQGIEAALAAVGDIREAML